MFKVGQRVRVVEGNIDGLDGRCGVIIDTWGENIGWRVFFDDGETYDMATDELTCVNVTIIEGELNFYQGSQLDFIPVVEGINLNAVIRGFDNKRVRITIEEVEG